jgi:hypothetical protein
MAAHFLVIRYAKAPTRVALLRATPTLSQGNGLGGGGALMRVGGALDGAAEGLFGGLEGGAYAQEDLRAELAVGLTELVLPAAELVRGRVVGVVVADELGDRGGPPVFGGVRGGVGVE